MAKKTNEEYNKAFDEMTAYLRTLPVTKCVPALFHEKFLNDLSLLEDKIQRLSKFVKFLSKLNPLQYLDWMKEAFSKVVHIPQENIATQQPRIENKPVNTYPATTIAAVPAKPTPTP